MSLSERVYAMVACGRLSVRSDLYRRLFELAHPDRWTPCVDPRRGDE